MSTFDPTKPVRTRDGRPARIICTDAAGKYPIVALILDKDGEEEPQIYTASGDFYCGNRGESDRDLINIPERFVRWVNVYSGGGATVHRTRDTADKWKDSRRIACVRLEFEEGEGLS